MTADQLERIAALIRAQAKYLCTTDYEGRERKRQRLDELVSDVIGIAIEPRRDQ